MDFTWGARPLEKTPMFFLLALSFSLCLSLFKVSFLETPKVAQTRSEFNGRSQSSLDEAIIQGKAKGFKGRP